MKENNFFNSSTNPPISAAQELANSSPSVFGDYDVALEFYCNNRDDVKRLIDNLEDVFHATRISTDFYCKEENPIILWFRRPEKKSKKAFVNTAHGIGSIIEMLKAEIRLRVFVGQNYLDQSLTNALCTYDHMVNSKNLPNAEDLAKAMI